MQLLLVLAGLEYNLMVLSMQVNIVYSSEDPNAFYSAVLTYAWGYF